ncbi:hypothetical protein ACVRYP_03880 [Streptococcus rifensis]
MKKSFFQKTYNVNFRLLEFIGLLWFLSFVSFVIPFGFHASIFNRKVIINIQEISTKVTLVLLLLSLVLLVILSILLSIEIVHRFSTDSLSNFIKSIQQTSKLRQFLIQIEAPSSIHNRFLNTAYPTVSKDFNKITHLCTVDKRKNSILVFLKYPKTQQAQQLFKEMEEHIKEEISNYNPEYYFSAPTRIGNNLWFKGSKR